MKLKYEIMWDEYNDWFENLSEENQSAYGQYIDYSDHEDTMGCYCPPFDYKQFVYRFKKYGKFWK